MTEPHTEAGRALLKETKGLIGPWTPFRQEQLGNAILAIEQQAQILRPRWHHDKTLSPEDRQYCEDCAELERRAAQPSGEALDESWKAAVEGKVIKTADRLLERLMRLHEQGILDDGRDHHWWHEFEAEFHGLSIALHEYRAAYAAATTDEEGAER